MHFETVILIVFFAYFRKKLNTKAALPAWDTQFLWGLGAAIGLAVVEILWPRAHVVTLWMVHLFAAAVVYLCFKHAELKLTRPYLMASLPLLAVNFLEDVVTVISKRTANRWEEGFDVAGLVGISWFVIVLWMGRRQRKALEKERKKAEEREREFNLTQLLKDELEIQVQERTAALSVQKAELEHALADLRATQSQLIQSEKMASLGELTAGIAHEIQNPLNFVNNFSDVSVELLQELLEEVERGNATEIKAIAGDLTGNLEKIRHHGKRADAIVKGMLHHSRSSSGKKEPTDINALADEYLRLAYHGLRAKDKSLNANMKTDFDDSLDAGEAGVGKVNIVPQDIGRVILNLITNAFYAVDEKKKSSIADYEPTVSVSTKKIEGKIEIRVVDNGNGIPQRILDKIFQPFFTTKPTGQGTGLGLSLSYDIVKAHGGALKVETKEGEGSAFVISLPAV